MFLLLQQNISKNYTRYHYNSTKAIISWRQLLEQERFEFILYSFGLEWRRIMKNSNLPRSKFKFTLWGRKF